MYKCNFFVSEQMQRWNILGNFLPKNKPLIGWSSRLTNQRPSFWQEIALNMCLVPSMPFSKNGNFSCDLMKIHEIKLPLLRHFSNDCTTYKCILFFNRLYMSNIYTMELPGRIIFYRISFDKIPSLMKIHQNRWHDIGRDYQHLERLCKTVDYYRMECCKKVSFSHM